MVKLVKNRAEPILEYIKGKSLLEIGCVGMGKHDIMGGRNFIAGYVKPLAKKWVGIDINVEGIKKMKEKGFDARLVNAEKKFNLNEKFDVILVEEVIEHLSDFPTFLKNVYNHIKSEGLLIISTPNPISPSFFFQRFFGGKIKDVAIWNHTHWHTHETIKCLLDRYKFKVVYYEYIHPEPAEKQMWWYPVGIMWRFVPKIFGRNLLIISKVNK